MGRRRQGVMSEGLKYELAKDLGFYDVVQKEGWEAIRAKDAGNMVKRAIQIAQEHLVKQHAAQRGAAVEHRPVQPAGVAATTAAGYGAAGAGGVARSYGGVTGSAGGFEQQMRPVAQSAVGSVWSAGGATQQPSGAGWGAASAGQPVVGGVRHEMGATQPATGSVWRESGGAVQPPAGAGWHEAATVQLQQPYTAAQPWQQPQWGVPVAQPLPASFGAGASAYADAPPGSYSAQPAYGAPAGKPAYGAVLPSVYGTARTAVPAAAVRPSDTTKWSMLPAAGPSEQQPVSVPVVPGVPPYGSLIGGAVHAGNTQPNVPIQ